MAKASSSEKRVLGPGFHQKVFAVVRKIPAGRVSAYGDIAKKLGSVSVSRHVGFALAQSSAEKDFPWYRVVNSQGYISMDLTDPRGKAQKRHLKREGVELSDKGKVINFKELRYL